MKKITEKVIQNLEEKIPEIAKDLAKHAYLKALASGSSVLIAQNGDLIEVYPDGKRKVLQKIEPQISAKKGVKFKI